MTHVFISYVSEDARLVDYLVELFKRNGIEAWIDRENIPPGLRWKDAIREAIQQGYYFVPIFSRAWVNRDKTYANTELADAIEELKLRPRNRAWFIPLRIDDCTPPNPPIGGGERLDDIQRIDVPALEWREAFVRLLRAFGVDNPILEIGEPLGAGAGPRVDFTHGGQIITARSEPAVPAMQGAIFTVTDGFCARTTNGNIVAHIKTRAPNSHLQQVNEMLGLAGVYAVTTDRHLSVDQNNPTIFSNTNDYIFPPGTQLFNIMTAEYVTLHVQMTYHVDFVAKGIVDNGVFRGEYVVDGRFTVPGLLDMPVKVSGTFYITFQAGFGLTL